MEGVLADEEVDSANDVWLRHELRPNLKDARHRVDRGLRVGHEHAKHAVRSAPVRQSQHLPLHAVGSDGEEDGLEGNKPPAFEHFRGLRSSGLGAPHDGKEVRLADNLWFLPHDLGILVEVAGPRLELRHIAVDEHTD